MWTSQPSQPAQAGAQVAQIFLLGSGVLSAAAAAADGDIKYMSCIDADSHGPVPTT